MKNIVYIVLLAFSDCKAVINGAPTKDCIFPFTFNDVTHFTCSRDNVPQNKTWCSALVDELGNHVNAKGNAGFCGPNCPLEGKNSRYNL